MTHRSTYRFKTLECLFPVKLEKASSCQTTSVPFGTSMCVNSRNQLMCYEVVRGTNYITVMDRHNGVIARRIQMKCKHWCSINELPGNPNYVLETCCKCEVIRAYDISTGTGKSVLKQCKVLRICSGPGQSLIGITPRADYYALQLQWNKDKEELSIVTDVPTQLQYLRELCYIEKYDLLVSLFWDRSKQ